MLLTIINDTHIRLDIDGQDELEIDGGALGPLQMLACSLALCTAATLHEYATTAQFRVEPFALDVRWRVAERPSRIERFDLQVLAGPHVPPDRQAALLRAAEQCTVHTTLSRGAQVVTGLEVEGAQQV